MARHTERVQTVHRYKEPCAWLLCAVARGRLAPVIDARMIREILHRS